MAEYHSPEKDAGRNAWLDVLNKTIDSNKPCTQHFISFCLDWLFKIDSMFPQSKVVKWITSKLRFVSAREFKNTFYNIMTGYGHYAPPGELVIPKGCYFNPYVRGMLTPFPPFLKDNMLQYEDGVKSSTPQMAYDLTEFLSFLDYGHIPDRKFDLTRYPLVFTLSFAVWSIFPLGLIFLYRRHQIINALSYRMEVYGLRSGGFRRFRERFINHNKPDA